MLRESRDVEPLNGTSILQNRLRIVMMLTVIRDAEMTPPTIWAHDPQKPDDMLMLKTGKDGELNIVIGRDTQIVDQRHGTLQLTEESVRALEEALQEAARREKEREIEQPALAQPFRTIMEPTRRKLATVREETQVPPPPDVQKQRQALARHLAEYVFLYGRDPQAYDDGAIIFRVSTRLFDETMRLIGEGKFQPAKIRMGRNGILDAIGGLATRNILIAAQKLKPSQILYQLGRDPYGLAWQKGVMCDSSLFVLNQSYVDANRIK